MSKLLLNNFCSQIYTCAHYDSFEPETCCLNSGIDCKFYNNKPKTCKECGYFKRHTCNIHNSKVKSWMPACNQAVKAIELAQRGC